MQLAKKITLQYLRSRLKLMATFSSRKAAEKAFEIFITPHSRLDKKPAAIFEKAEKLVLDFNGLRVKGYRWNHPSPKKLLILHGYESGILNFDRYIAPLVRKGYEVIGMDAPAHGKSSGKMVNAVDYKNFILFLMKELGPIKNFISHSFGGLGLSLALEETKHDKTYRAVFIAPATESTTAMNQFFKLMQLSPEVRVEFDKVITEANNKPPSWYSVARASAKIKAEVLFLQDKADPLTPYADVKPIIEKKYPNFRFVITRGLGHRKIYREPQQVKLVTDFF